MSLALMIMTARFQALTRGLDFASGRMRERANELSRGAERKRRERRGGGMRVAENISADVRETWIPAYSSREDTRAAAGSCNTRASRSARHRLARLSVCSRVCKITSAPSHSSARSLSAATMNWQRCGGARERETSPRANSRLSHIHAPARGKDLSGRPGHFPNLRSLPSEFIRTWRNTCDAKSQGDKNAYPTTIEVR